MEPCGLTAAEMRAKLDSREISAVELTQAHLDRIEQLDKELQAFLHVCEDTAHKQAKIAQRMIDSGDANAMTGIPVALKDNMITKGIPTTCASRILEGYVPPYEGTAALRLKQSGAVLLGKTNLDEFAMGSSTERSAYFPSKNPWDLERSPGGSSGGSAVAAAASLAAITYGSDTGGSVRQPAALTGVVGFKPTYGRVSRYGLVAFASSLDQIGPFARTVTDAISGFEAVMGHDPKDSTCVSMPYDSAAARIPNVRGKKLAIIKELSSDSVEQGVRDGFRAAVDKLVAEGAIVEEISLPMVEFGVSTYYIIAPAEASSNLARYDGVRYGLRVQADNPIDLMRNTRSAGFGPEVQERIVIGTYVLSSGYYDAFYAKAHRARTLMKKQMREAFEKFDAIISPTSPTVAFKLGELLGDPLALKLADLCTIPANMGGFPAISVPCGLSDGLPVGFQIVCDSFREDHMFSIALAAEQCFGKLPPPPLAT